MYCQTNGEYCNSLIAFEPLFQILDSVINESMPAEDSQINYIGIGLTEKAWESQVNYLMSRWTHSPIFVDGSLQSAVRFSVGCCVNLFC